MNRETKSVAETLNSEVLEKEASEGTELRAEVPAIEGSGSWAFVVPGWGLC